MMVKGKKSDMSLSSPGEPVELIDNWEFNTHKMSIGEKVKLKIGDQDIEAMGKWGFGDIPLGDEISFVGRFDKSVLDMPEKAKSFFNQKANQEINFYAPPRRYVFKDATSMGFDYAEFSATMNFRGEKPLIQYPIEYQFKNFLCKLFEKIGSLM